MGAGGNNDMGKADKRKGRKKIGFNIRLDAKKIAKSKIGGIWLEGFLKIFGEMVASLK